MSAEHGPYEEKENTEPDNVNVGLVTTVALVGAALTLSIALALTALVRNEADAHGNQVGAHANLGGVARLKAAQRGKLEAPPAWSDRAKGLVALPIDRAMDLVTADIQKNPGHATKVNPADVKKDDAVDGGAGGGTGASEQAPSGDPAAAGEKTPSGDPAAAGEKTPSGDPAAAGEKTPSGDPAVKAPAPATDDKKKKAKAKKGGAAAPAPKAPEN